MRLQHLKLYFRLSLLIILVVCLPIPSLAAEPHVTAKAAILIEAKTGKILYEKASHQPLYPASTTKVVTAILGLELASMDEIVTISKNSARVSEASIYLEENQQVYVEDLVRGALIKSGNDAAHAIGEHIGGSESVFLMIMNKKAAILGAKNTSFHNTNGLPNEKHFSSAYDLALIGRYSMQNSLFSEFVKVKEDQLQFVSGERRYLKNTNKLLWNYPYATGIKTGTTRAAGQCLIASAEKDNLGLIAVVLGSKARYVDVINLFEYGFGNWVSYSLPKNTFMGQIAIKYGLNELLNLRLSENINEVYQKGSTLTVKKNLKNNIYPPVAAGTEVGVLEVYIDDIKVRSVPITAQNSIQKINFIEKLKGYF
ncbi:MAG: hypothetical protein APF76_04345 [Desulfitibacter sp. BRH_c19]|nr:MAG: hypothetical protein APF76_04345 [Desulfitibacter sp. BRH_c19]